MKWLREQEYQASLKLVQLYEKQCAVELALLKEQKYKGLTVDNVIFKQFTEMRNRIRFLIILSRDGGKVSYVTREPLIEYHCKFSVITYDTFNLVKAAVIKELKRFCR